jgi:hypothetical protein
MNTCHYLDLWRFHVQSGPRIQEEGNYLDKAISYHILPCEGNININKII